MYPGLQAIIKLHERHQLWRILIDGCYHVHGPFYLDDYHGLEGRKGLGEAGYCAGILKGLAEIIATFAKPLDLDLLGKIHDAAATKEVGIGFAFSYAFDRFSVNSKTTTLKGVREFLDGLLDYYKGNDFSYPVTLHYGLLSGEDSAGVNVKNIDEAIKDVGDSIDTLTKGIYETISSGSGFGTLFSFNEGWNSRKEYVRREIEKYKHAIASADTEDQKIAVIVQLVRNCEQIHPFDDGNCRTMYLLLQKLLLEQGFLPTLLDDPNVLDLYSVQELVDLVKAGFERVKALTLGGKDLALEDDGRYRAMLKELKYDEVVAKIRSLCFKPIPELALTYGASLSGERAGAVPCAPILEG